MLIKESDYKYVIMNKPSGYVCAIKDNFNKTIFSLVKENIKGLHIVGRLDKDTTGIIILTNDGNYTHNATHPKKHAKKTYLVDLMANISKDDIKEIEAGMYINHGKTKLKPANIKVINKNQVLLTITEGKFHQVKKMFFALSNRVTNLMRVEFDGRNINNYNLKEGEYVIFCKDDFIKNHYKSKK